MAKPVTEKFEQMVLEVSSDAGVTWKRVCGLVDVTVTRTTSFDTDEVPADCEDESKPLETVRQARTQEVTVSATGKWAQQSHKLLSDWWYGASSMMGRIGNLNAAVGDTEYEKGPLFLTSLANSRTKGQTVTASVEFVFDGLPTRTAKA